MASSTSTKQGSPRRLAELLDEQQEPFVLELYLLERGYRIRKNLGLEGTILSTKLDYEKNLKKSISVKSSTQFSNMAKTLLSKLISRKKPSKRRDKEGVGSMGRCSSFSCSTNNTWSESDTDGEIISMPSPRMKKTAHHDESAQWRFVEENKQCSPDSVLDEIDLLQGIPLCNVRQPQEENNSAESRTGFQKKVTGDAILPGSLWELLAMFTAEKPKQQGRRKPFTEYVNSKKTLQKNRQLLFDCVREAVENGNQLKSCFRNSKERGLKIGPAEIGKVICKNSKVWGKLSVDEPNVQMIIRRDLYEAGTADEWGSFEVWKSDIVAEIGNGIVDEITDEMIRDMID